jgi:predicted alpha/beta hydrolase
MNKLFTIKLIAIQAIITPATSIFAHDGHNLQGSHWHASDAFGFVILAAAIGLTLWFGRGGK